MDASTDPEPFGGDVGDSSDALISRLQLIEAQPLADRAAGYGQLHDELIAALEQRDAR